MQRRNISEIERKAIIKAWGNKCAYCTKDSDDFHLDHIVPKCKEGQCDIENLCPACPDCNLRKNGAELPETYQGLMLTLAGKKAKKIRALIAREEARASSPRKKNGKRQSPGRVFDIYARWIIDQSIIQIFSGQLKSVGASWGEYRAMHKVVVISLGAFAEFYYSFGPQKEEDVQALFFRSTSEASTCCTFEALRFPRQGLSWQHLFNTCSYSEEEGNVTLHPTPSIFDTVQGAA